MCSKPADRTTSSTDGIAGYTAQNKTISTTRNSKTEHNYSLHLKSIPERKVQLEEEKKNPVTVIPT